MDVSAILNSGDISAYYDYYQLLQSELVGANTSGASYNTTASDAVSMSISNEALSLASMPAPPDSVDFENLSDEDFQAYLQQCIAAYGQLPGMSAVTDVSALSDDDLEALKVEYAQMSQNAPGGQFVANGSAPKLSQTLANIDDDGLKTILAGLLEKNGSIPGVGSNIKSVDDLTQEQLDTARETMVEEAQIREDEMAQRYNFYSTVISTYEKNLMYEGVAL